ncbi:Bacterial Ig-like domain (group 2) [compost metagenome]
MESLNVGFSSADAGKLISNHSTDWQTSLGSAGPRGPFIRANNIEELGGNNYLVIGSIDHKLQVWRLDSTKTISWSNNYPNLSSVGDIVAEADGGYSIAGTNATNQIVLIKNDANNNEIFQQTLSFGGELKSLVTTADDGYYFATTEGLYKTDASGNVQWSQSINNLSQVITTKDGGAAVIADSKLLKFNNGGSIPETESLHFDSSLYTLTVGQTLDTVVNARNGSTVTDVTYEANFSSDDDSIVSIDEFGNITGLQSGKTNIRATWNGKEAQATVIVFNIYTGLRLDDTEYSVNIGQPIDLVATYQEGDQFTNVTTSSSYSTSDPSIAIVDQEGSIIGLKRGQTTLTVTYNGVHTTATIHVY